ncbi:MAG TPA: anti-sigma factor [Ornithinimicrobium sp.]|uniref:anti-sigma factor n=1 Tax=Ornithinimicrobium sp. TaxID=1977084 RepID=UPI002B49D050|nr:anti-sigma factor [Ornithinimicrobium sp.]HKJ12117.1 anti-sigma factor [Ornithinimicrobium sp.]
MTASDRHVDDLIASFALDAVDDTERRLVQAHLEGCERCRAELREFSEAAVHLMDGAEVEPPRSLRSSVLAAVASEPQNTVEDSGDGERETSPETSTEHVQQPPPESDPAPESGATASSGQRSGEARSRRHGTTAWWSLAAAGLLAVGGWGIWQSLEEDLSPAEEVIQAEDAQRYQTEYEGEAVTVVASAELDRAVLVTDELPELGDDEVYQGWWIDDEGTITSAGVLQDAAGAAEAQTVLQGDPDAVSNFALSVEPDEGSEQPTTEPVLVLPLES